MATLAKLRSFICACRSLAREIKTFPASVRSERAALAEKWSQEDVERQRRETVLMLRYRRQLERVLRLNPWMTLRELERRVPFPSVNRQRG